VLAFSSELLTESVPWVGILFIARYLYRIWGFLIWDLQGRKNNASEGKSVSYHLTLFLACVTGQETAFFMLSWLSLVSDVSPWKCL
jgi:hypothetical protein